MIKDRTALNESYLEKLEQVVMNSSKAQAILDAARMSMGKFRSVRYFKLIALPKYGNWGSFEILVYFKTVVIYVCLCVSISLSISECYRSLICGGKQSLKQGWLIVCYFDWQGNLCTRDLNNLVEHSFSTFFYCCELNLHIVFNVQQTFLNRSGAVWRRNSCHVYILLHNYFLVFLLFYWLVC